RVARRPGRPANDNLEHEREVTAFQNAELLSPIAECGSRLLGRHDLCGREKLKDYLGLDRDSTSRALLAFLGDARIWSDQNRIVRSRTGYESDAEAVIELAQKGIINLVDQGRHICRIDSYVRPVIAHAQQQVVSKRREHGAISAADLIVEVPDKTVDLTQNLQ